MQRLALYSRSRFQKLSTELKLDYEQSNGYLVLLRSEKDSQLLQPGLQVLRDAGGSFAELSAAEARLIEPALDPSTALYGAILSPQDQVANCRQFTLLLKNEAQRRGVNFCFNTQVRALDRHNQGQLFVENELAVQSFDAIVLCAGVESARLLRDAGLSIPMVAVYGYSISAPLRDEWHAPRSAVMDERYKVAISRLGQRVRVAGSTEIGGSLARTRESTLRSLYPILNDWFPAAARLSSGVQEWKGARPMLPDGPPLLGPSGIPGVWLNIGHGSSGWGLSCGSARALADLVAQRQPELDLQGLGLERWHR